MTNVTKLKPREVADRLNRGDAILIDIREPNEHARENISGAVLFPASALDQSRITIEAGKHAIFHCRTGMRTQSNCANLAAHVDGEVFVLEGGLDAWRAAGLPVNEDKSQPLDISRQTSIAAGTLTLTGAILGAVVHPAFYGLAAFVGAGLLLQGLSGWCGMAIILNAMPWNRQLTS